jgi:hypothetical protein
VVCKTVGYARYTNERALAAVYQVINLPPNYFYPCAKLIDKMRDTQGKTKKTYDQPVTSAETAYHRPSPECSG